MHSLIRTTVLPADPDSVWRVIGRFNGLADWHPQVPPSIIEDGADPETPGAVRTFTIDGEVAARERLLAKDDTLRVYRYSLLYSVLPITDYEATLAVLSHDEGAEVRWTATYRGADEAVPQVEEVFGEAVFATGLAALHVHFAAHPAVE
ncbi:MULTISPECIES: SRPBCC family protein [Streptomyces]|uniref:SRPBCC family protein n=1 Tax=Streptomyces TaxID=1883 RepID=UPI00069B1FC4|nr:MULTISPECIES: SRPBCC family protein [Streptomyces]MYU51464.1 SRPBCC family protein [Streptomyces sp. SID7805]